MLESAVVKAVLKFLRSRGAAAEKIHGSALQRRGMPDIDGVYRSISFKLEAKLPPSKKSCQLNAIERCDYCPTKIQRKALKDYATAGAATDIVRSIEDAATVLDRIDAFWERIKNGEGREQCSTSLTGR